MFNFREPKKEQIIVNRTKRLKKLEQNQWKWNRQTPNETKIWGFEMIKNCEWLIGLIILEWEKVKISNMKNVYML